MMSSFLPGASRHPDEHAVLSPDGDRTFADLERNAHRVASGFIDFGLVPGDRVAVMAFNRPEHVEMLLGSFLAGMEHVPVNWHLTWSEAAFILENSGARVLLADPEHEEVAREAATRSGVDHLLVTGPPFADWLSAHDRLHPLDGPAGSVVFYTSGTTGRPKGVKRSDQGGPLAELWPRMRGVAERWGFRDGGTYLVACPLYHATPLAHALFSTACSQSLVLLPRFDEREVIAAIERHQVTATHLVPTQLIRLLRLPPGERSPERLVTLETLWHGAAPCPAWAKRAAIDWLGPIVVEYFGSSEGTGPLIATSEEWLAHPGTVGRPVTAVQVTAVDDEGRDLPQGEVGTLYFRRPDGAPKYLGAEESTAESRLVDGRFTVGDVGWVDDDGFVYLADRKVDMIISGGVNIYPAEVEAALSEHPAVVDAAVFGVPDDEWGEHVRAAVQLTAGSSATVEELQSHCRERLAGYKCPRVIDVLDELPREASGKLKKRLLRDPFWGNRERPI